MYTMLCTISDDTYHNILIKTICIDDKGSGNILTKIKFMEYNCINIKKL